MRRLAVCVLAAGLLAGCGGGSTTTTSTTTTNSHLRAAALGHQIGDFVVMFSGGPRVALRRFGDRFQALSPAQQKTAVRALARDLDRAGYTPLSEGKQRAVLTGFANMEGK